MSGDGIHSRELLKTGHERIGQAERTHGAQPGKLGVLKQHAEHLEELENRYEREGVDPWRQALLAERRDAFRERLEAFLEPGDTFGTQMPGQDRAFEVRTRIDEGVRSGRFNPEERLYLEAHATKSEHLRRDFESGGWTAWRKQLFLERQDAMDRLLHDYAQGEHNPQGG